MQYMKTGEFLKSWREELNVKVSSVALASGMTPEFLMSVESDTTQLSIGQIASISSVLGLSQDQLLEDDVRKEPFQESVGMLMKSAEAFSATDTSRLAMVSAAKAAVELIQMRKDLRHKQIALPLSPAKTTSPPFADGANQAKLLRSTLAINGPIPSVRDLVSSRLEIPLLLSNLSKDGPDAMSVYFSGQAAIVLNCVGKNENSLMRRFNVLHELAHVLLDRPAQGSFAVACTDSEQSLAIEQRANAFAIRMLLPESDLKEVSNIENTTVFRSTMEKWGVSRSALELYARNYLNLTEAPNVSTSAPLIMRDAEELDAESMTLGFPIERCGKFLACAIEGVRKQLWSSSRASEMLFLDATVSLTSIAKKFDYEI